MTRSSRAFLLVIFSAWCSVNAYPAETAPTDNFIHPGAVWLDDRGLPIQAHGGGIVKFGNEWFWFGEDRSKTEDQVKHFISCYSSTDLIHWKFRHQVIASGPPFDLGQPWILERPKVFYNAPTKKFVMYCHLDGPAVAGDAEGKIYARAMVGVAVSDAVDGDYKFVSSFRPLGFESRDIGQFIDDDGNAYLIFESRPSHGFYIAKLSEDYLKVEKQVAFIHQPLEGGTMVHYGGRYFIIASHLTGWAPNPNIYATAPKLEGPWSEFKDIADPKTNTYGSQSTFLLKVIGTQATTVIFVADIWKPKELSDSRYLWMPLDIHDDSLSLPPPREWTINATTGVVTYK